MILACSHVVIAVTDVASTTKIFSELFEIAPYFESKEFSEFVLPSKHRIAFFRPVGPAAKFFKAEGERHHVSLGLTVKDVEGLHARAVAQGLTVSGPPKDHPWGEKSFLLVDKDGTRWEITESPSPDGMLVNR